MRTVVLFLTIGFLLYVVFFFNFHRKGLAAFHEKQKVKLVLVKEMPISPKLSAMGVLRPFKGIQLSAPISGVIKKIYFKSQQFVEKGDLLIELSNDDLKSKLAEDLEKYHYILKQYWRYQKLFKSGAIASADMDRLDSSVIEAKAIYKFDEALLNKTLIRAPFSGRLGINRVSEGQYLSAGMAIVSLYDLSRVLVDFSFPQNLISYINKGAKIKIYNPKNSLIIYFGKIISTGVRLSQETLSQNFRAEINSDFKALGLLPGMFVKVELILPKNDCSIFIPDSAVLYSPEGEFAFVFQAGLVRREKILLGEDREGWVQIKTGLHPMDEVVVSGFENLFDSEAVEVKK